MRRGCTGGVKSVAVFSDCGPHFQCTTFLAHLLVRLRKRYQLQETTACFAAPGHGKSRCDSHFGHMSHYRDVAARSTRISSVADYVAAQKMHADSGLATDYERVYLEYMPPDKKTQPTYRLDDVALRARELPIKTTFWWRGRTHKNRDMIEKLDGPMGKAVHSCIAPWTKVPEPESEDNGKTWRQYYCTNEPEKSLPKIPYMRTMSKALLQGPGGPVDNPRRPPLEKRKHRFQLTRAHKMARAKAFARAVQGKK